MACQITYKDEEVLANNLQFGRLMDFGIEIAQRTASEAERPILDRVKELWDDGFFFPGRGIDIEKDFPDIQERKFLSRVFFDTSRAIFDRTIGLHEHSFWQAQAIHQAHATGLIFEHAVRDAEGGWSANTLDRRQFDKVINGIER